MAAIIAPTTAEATSADFTLTASSTTLYLTGAAGSGPKLPIGAVATVQIKSGTDYYTIGTLDGEIPAKVLNATGTFRVLKPTTQVACGVNRD